MTRNEQPSISVVVPLYNVEATLDSTLATVVSQSYSNWSIVMVNDGSTDHTSDVARKWLGDSRFSLVEQENSGVSSARNRGVRESPPNTKYIAFLDGDDLWEPTALELLSDAIEANPEMVGAHARSRYVDQSGIPLAQNRLDIPRRRVVGSKRVRCGPDDPTDFDVLAFMLPINIGNVIVRRVLFDKVGGFDETMRYSEDWDLWLRLSLLGPFAYCDQIILNYRLRPGSAMDRLRPDAKALIRQDYVVRRKLIESEALSSGQRDTAIRSQPAWFLKTYALERFKNREIPESLHLTSAILRAVASAGLDRLNGR